MDFQASHFHRAAEIEDMGIGMRYGYVSREHVEFRRANIGQVPHRTIRDDSDATEREENVRVNLADKCTEAWWVVHVLYHDDARSRNGKNLIPPIGAVVVVVGFVGFHARIGTTQTSRGRIPGHRGLILEDAPDSGVGKAGVWQPHAKSFNRARDQASA